MPGRWKPTATLCASCEPSCTWLSACYMTTAMATFFSKMKVVSARALSVNTAPCTRAASMAVALASRWDELHCTGFSSLDTWMSNISNGGKEEDYSNLNKIKNIYYSFFFSIQELERQEKITETLLRENSWKITSNSPSNHLNEQHNVSKFPVQSKIPLMVPSIHHPASPDVSALCARAGHEQGKASHISHEPPIPSQPTAVH